MNRFCRKFHHNPTAFLKTAAVPNFKLFWLWTLNSYKRIKAGSSVENYWRVLRMHIHDAVDRSFNDADKRDILNVRLLPLALPQAKITSRLCTIYQRGNSQAQTPRTAQEKALYLP